jgi:hypothetical protein
VTVKVQLCLTLLVFAVVAPLRATEVLLKNSWIDQHKNRVTTDITFRVEKAHKHPNPIGEKSDDGDMHLAGRSPEVGLPMVVEIVNAALPDHTSVLAAVKTAVSQTANVNMSGVWRLWFEHPGKKTQHQGQPVGPPKHTNPDHVFEIHPVTQWEDDPLDESFVPIDGFTAHDAATAFARYENMVVTVAKGQSFTSFETKMIGYNYTEFIMVLTSAAKKVDDGSMALARVADLDGKIIVNSPRRMVFADDTPPAALIAKAKAGARFQALGIPRLNLERLMLKAEAADGESVDVKGAYEMIVVGITDNHD